MRGVAVGIALGVLMTMLASVTLLPALLGFVGRNIDKLGLPHRKRAAGRDTRVVLVPVEPRDPAPPVAGGDPRLVVLLVLALPVFSHAPRASPTPATGPRPTRPARPTTCSPRASGPGSTARCCSRRETARRRRRPRDARASSAQQLERDAGRRVRVAAAAATQTATAAIMQVFPTTSPQDEATADLVHRLRDDVVPDGSRRAPTST